MSKTQPRKPHRHVYSHTGGGCLTIATAFPCDDTYECGCGATVSFATTRDAHFAMPEQIIIRLNPGKIVRK